MKKNMRYVCALAGAAGLFLAGSLMHSAGSQAKGAYATPVQVTNTTASSVPVSPAVPGAPFLQELSNSGSNLQAFGPGTGNSFAITSLTLTNFNPTQSEVIRVFQPSLTGGFSCSSTTVNGGGQSVRVNLQPGESMHLTYPSPMVMFPSSGLLCGGVSFTGAADGSLYMTAVGYSN